MAGRHEYTWSQVMVSTMLRVGRVALVLPILAVLSGQGGDRASAQAVTWPFHLEWEAVVPIGTSFQLCIDGNCQLIAAAPWGGVTWRAPLPLLPPGEHRLVVQSCTDAGCVPGTPDLMVRVTAPSGSSRQPPIDVVNGPRIPLPRR
jgi:hypothetical protein